MYAQRNRSIKQTLERAFGKGRVRVFSHRGTASHWATINIAYQPKDYEQRRELTSKVWELLRALKADIPTFGYDDPGSDYGFGSCLHINFEQNCGETAQ
jgi:hypothetical protein